MFIYVKNSINVFNIGKSILIKAKLIFIPDISFIKEIFLVTYAPKQIKNRIDIFQMFDFRSKCFCIQSLQGIGASFL